MIARTDGVPGTRSHPYPVSRSVSRRDTQRSAELRREDRIEKSKGFCPLFLAFLCVALRSFVYLCVKLRGRTARNAAWPHERSMAKIPEIADGTSDRQERPSRGVVRQTVELLVSLVLCVIVVRTFSAEAYVVPTGSMAPTLLGWHRELVCPNCQYPFDVGIDEEGRAGSPVCPNCGEANFDPVPALECGGDRVLVQKFLYEFRPPKRWEVAVFHYPGDPSQAYVKRVVGLPGESVRISDGDVYADGRILRKTLED